MQFFATSLILGLMALYQPAVAQNSNLEIEYMSDSSCQDFSGYVEVSWATNLYASNNNNCFNYSYGNSVKIGSCWAGSCQCNFFYEENCQGGSSQVLTYSSGSGSCVGGASQLKSFACYYL